MKFDVLLAPTILPKGRVLLRAFTTGALRKNHDTRMIVSGVKVRADAILVTYGPGGDDRKPNLDRHQAKGGRYLCFDAGYWDRKLHPDIRRYRVSIDNPHPRGVLLGPTPNDNRRISSGVAIEPYKGFGPGPILLIGNAPKSVKAYAGLWSVDMLRALRDRFPGRPIVYRPKPDRPPERGILCDGMSTGPIEKAMDGVFLVVCRHSNVAVDACRLGVPVVATDGAAACIYPNRIEDYERQPSDRLRAEFLDRLAWWQWSTQECSSGAIFPWLETQLRLNP